VAGLPELLAAAPDFPLEAICGTEFSVDYKGTELHLLALFLKPEDFDKITAITEDFHRRKDESNITLVRNLAKDGYDIDYNEIKSATRGVVNRAHIAGKLVEKGYTGSIKEAFATLLSKDGRYFVQPRRLDVFETIEFIKSIGAVAVLAHPFLNLSEAELREFLPEAIRHGLDGMETLYSTYDDETTSLSISIAREYGLVESGGSDFHGTRKPDIELGTGRGNLCVPDTFLQNLRSRI
jgi:predicted metal-dependent phosphoesterase TrpH